ETGFRNRSCSNNETGETALRFEPFEIGHRSSVQPGRPRTRGDRALQPVNCCSLLPFQHLSLAYVEGTGTFLLLATAHRFLNLIDGAPSQVEIAHGKDQVVLLEPLRICGQFARSILAHSHASEIEPNHRTAIFSGGAGAGILHFSRKT